MSFRLDDLLTTTAGSAPRDVVLQAALYAVGLPLALDDDAGPDTRRKLSSFQQSRGLPDTGRLDASTLQRLAAEVRARLRALPPRGGLVKDTELAFFGDSQSEGIALVAPAGVTVSKHRGASTQVLAARLLGLPDFGASERVVVVQGGGNDVLTDVDAARIIVQLQAIGLRLAERRPGLRVVLATIPPRDHVFVGARGERQRVAFDVVNTWIRGTHGDNPFEPFDCAPVVGQAPDFRVPATPFRTRDQHLTTAGYRKLLSAVRAAFVRGAAPTPPTTEAVTVTGDPAPPSVAAGFLGADATLRTCALAPAAPWTRGVTAANGAIVRVHDRIGGLLEAASRRLGIAPEAALGVWMMESGGRDPVPNQALLRFENHLFWRRFAKGRPGRQQVYAQHFRHGQPPEKPWRDHLFNDDGAWHAHHGDQALERRALALAASLADEETACLCASFGSAQILGSNFAACGYASARALRAAFDAGERWQALGFFDFVRSNHLVDELVARNWAAFGKGYNGSGGSGYGNSLRAHVTRAADLYAANG